MNAFLRYLILVPLGLLLGTTAAMLALMILTLIIPDMAQTFGVLTLSAFDALFDALSRDDMITAASVAWRAWQLLLLVVVMPVMVTAVIGEFFRIGALAHGIAAGMIAAAVPLAAKLSISSAEGRVLACLFFSGFIGGIVYAAVGGRRESAMQAQPLPPR